MMILTTGVVDRSTVMVMTKKMADEDEEGADLAPDHSSEADPNLEMPLTIGPSEVPDLCQGLELGATTIGKPRVQRVVTAPSVPGAGHLRAAHPPRPVALSNDRCPWAADAERARVVTRAAIQVPTDPTSRSIPGSRATTMFIRRSTAMSTALTFSCVI